MLSWESVVVPVARLNFVIVSGIYMPPVGAFWWHVDFSVKFNFEHGEIPPLECWEKFL